MDNITRKNMKKIITILIAAFFIVSMAGCDPTDPVSGFKNPETEKTEALDVTFDLPEEWTWLNKDSLSAIWDETAKGGNAPFVKLSFIGMEKGTSEEAAEKTKETYDEHKKACEFAGDECEIPPGYEQYKIAGIDVTTAMSVGYVWGRPSWSSHIAFEKDGYVVELMLYDKATLHQNELKTIIGSMSW